jgi:hypothetical protein
MPDATADPSGAWVPAVGGARTVPAPDPVARDYIVLSLRLDQRIPGLVDGYFGPADLKAQVDMEQPRSPARLRDDAASLRARLPTEVADPARRAWLDAQLVALETQAAGLAGDELPYLEHVARCFAFSPPRRPDAEFEAAAARIDDLLPGDAPLSDRVEAWDRRFIVERDRLPAVIEALVARFRARAAERFGLPDGEDLRVTLVTGQPWSGYNWYDGGRRSRVDINTDLPVRVPDLIDTVAHETYPGHHLEHAWKEADLVEAQRRLEASILLINTPECLISEGLADLGRAFAVPDDEAVGLLIETFVRAGLEFADDAAAARETAERVVALAPARAALSAVRGNAAILRHADGRTHDEVREYLMTVGRVPASAVEKRLEFIEHPLWRTYVFVYAEGEALLRRWVDAVPVGERASRFGRLLHEQLTPAAVSG